jgi:hypothetical protein
MNENFFGQNGFYWFNGVVEDRNDPEKTGRVRVRIIGVHTDNKTLLPTADLPWCMVVLPITASGISGVGQSPLGLLEGSWVFGYFKDGSMQQEPVILGSLPGYPLELANTSKGFYDPAGIYPRFKNEPDVHRLAVNNEDNPSLSLLLRQATRITGVPTADYNTQELADGNTTAASDGTTWNQPEIPYQASYPYNHTYESESGHIREFDDTPGHQRIYESHRTGTSYEIDKDGNKIDIIKGDHYTLTSGANLHYIQGNSDVTISGRHKIYLNKDGQTDNHYDIQVGPNANINIQVDNGDINLNTINGRVNVNSGGDYNLKVGGNMNVDVRGNYTETIETNKTQNVTGTHIIRGETIDLNP